MHMAPNKHRRRRPLSASRLIALVFLGLILLGTALLCLPCASRSGRPCGVRTALFTATSATCVTGLILRDTWTQWSGFGQTVLILLIEIGGLGFMSAASFVIFTLRRRLNMRQRMAAAESIGASSMADAVRVYRTLLIGCLAAQLAGASILTVHFLPRFGFLRSAKLGLFHAVSAFCNAGFDILGFLEPGGSLIPFGTDAVVLLTLSFLIVGGGIGYLVWDELARLRSARRWSVYTKLVLITTGALLIGGAALFCLTEWNNPDTLGPMTVPQKLLAAFFQSVTVRTAGFAAIDQGKLTQAGKAVSMFFMLIGGSSGSTAGGLKTVTFVVLLLFLWARLRGRSSVSVFHRSIANDHVLNALTVFITMVGLAFIGGTFICATSPVSFADALYEAVSAIGTVGLTTGVTPQLTLPAQLLMIVYMYFGRVGVLTISLGFLRGSRSGQNYKYAETDLLIG